MPNGIVREDGWVEHPGTGIPTMYIDLGAITEIEGKVYTPGWGTAEDGTNLAVYDPEKNSLLTTWAYCH